MSSTKKIIISIVLFFAGLFIIGLLSLVNPPPIITGLILLAMIGAIRKVWKSNKIN